MTFCSYLAKLMTDCISSAVIYRVAEVPFGMTGFTIYFGPFPSTELLLLFFFSIIPLELSAWSVSLDSR